MAETPIYGLRELVAPNLDSALHAIVPKDHYAWETSIAVVNTPQGMQPQSIIMLTGPSPILGTGSLIAVASCDMRDFLDEPKALEAMRVLVERMRQMRAEMIAGPKSNGDGLHLA